MVPHSSAVVQMKEEGKARSVVIIIMDIFAGYLSVGGWRWW